MATYGQSIQRTTGASDPLVPEPVKGRRKMARPDAATLRKLLAQGKAMKNANGEPSFYIRNASELNDAIHRVGSVKPDTEAARVRVRQHIIKNAKKLGLTSQLPDTWDSTGHLKPGGDSSSSSGSSRSGSTNNSSSKRMDPDHDGDNDATPAGDTDHDNWSKDGKPLTPMARRLFAQRQKQKA